MRHDGSGAKSIPLRYRMDLRQFRYFIAVAEEGHITRAAERLGIQQPPLSRQIRSMEKELGVQLLRRKPRGVEMTAAGQALLDEANAIIGHVDRAKEKVRQTASGEQGRISVGVTPTGPFHPFVPQVIRAFRHAFPLVSVTIEEWASNELVERLKTEHIDVAFIRTLPADVSTFAVNPCLEEELIAVLPKAHALVQKGRRAEAALPLKRPRRRNLSNTGRAFRAQHVRRHYRRMSRCWVQSSDWSRSASARIDTQSGCCRFGRFYRSCISGKSAHGRIGVSSPQKPSPTCCTLDPLVAPR